MDQDAEKVYSAQDLVPSGDIAVAATGVSGGSLLQGVKYFGRWAETHSLVMRSRTGTVRSMTTRHHWGLTDGQATVH